jgi:hypothetical protein
VATLPSPHAWVAGDDATSANLQSMTAGLNFLLGGPPGAKPSFRMVATSTQWIANATTTTLIYGQVNEDNDSGCNAAAGEYTVRTAGLWLFTVAVAFASSTLGGSRHLYAIGSGAMNPATAHIAIGPAADPTGRLSTSLLARCAVNDTISAQVWQDTGGGLYTDTSGTVGGRSPIPALSGIWLGQ